MKKYIAQIVIEATSPLIVGSGKSGLDNDAVVAKDFNFLPYIPGTGLTGIISSIFEKMHDKDIKINVFGGDETKDKGDDKNKNKDKDDDDIDKETFLGSSFETSDALLVGDDKKVLQEVVAENSLSNFYKNFLRLPKREHVKINHKGTTDDGGKFDSEFVYKGSRFKFEVELMDNGQEDYNQYWEDILKIIKSKDFIIGSGTTNDYGNVKIESVKQRIFDLTKEKELEEYLKHTVDLNCEFYVEDPTVQPEQGEWQNIYTLNLAAEAIHIGAGYGDNDTDDANYKETVIEGWDSTPNFNKKYFVIPGTSVKGALSHRIAYYYYFNEENKITVEDIIVGIESGKPNGLRQEIDKHFIDFEKEWSEINNDKNLSLQEKKDKLNELKDELNSYKYEFPKNELNSTLLDNYIEEKNEAVKNLFGYAKDNEHGKMGEIIVKDIYIPIDEVSETLFDHNSIDRFTGGTIDTALFSEKVFKPENDIVLEVYKRNNTDTKYLELALKDLANGNLAIGGKTNKGYGFLLGTLKTNSNENK